MKYSCLAGASDLNDNALFIVLNFLGTW